MISTNIIHLCYIVNCTSKFDIEKQNFIHTFESIQRKCIPELIIAAILDLVSVSGKVYKQ